MSGFQIFAADATFQNRAARDLFTHPTKKNALSFPNFCQKAWPDKKALGVLHFQTMTQELRTLNRKFFSSLRNNLFWIKPRTGCHSDRLQLLYPLVYGPHSDALLQDNEEELDSHVWFDNLW